jgi:hypothetical protein
MDEDIRALPAQLERLRDQFYGREAQSNLVVKIPGSTESRAKGVYEGIKAGI